MPAMVLALARADPLIFRMCCGEKAAPPISYTGTTSTRVYSVHDISDVSLIVGQQAAFLCGMCCCICAAAVSALAPKNLPPIIDS